MTDKSCTFGCGKCLSGESGEVKFVNAVWVMFQFNPLHPQPCKRFRIIGWMSAVHWNGSEFRVGETGSGEDDGDDEGDEAIAELRSLIRENENQLIEMEFGQMVLDIEVICKPRMLLKKAQITAKKIEKLHKNFEQAQ